MLDCILGAGMKFLDNTFFGTLLAGIILAYIGRYLYVSQKKIDSTYNSQQNIKELSTELLTVLNVNIVDFCNQIDVISGVNAIGRVVKNRMEDVFPGQFIKQLASKYANAVNDINQIFNKLSTRLSLNSKYLSDLDLIKEKLPRITTYLSMTSALTEISVEMLNEIKASINIDFTEIKIVLEKIIK